MTEIITFTVAEQTPDRDAILDNQGIPAGAAVPAEVEALCATALELLAEVSAPSGIMREISATEFEHVYRGAGRNQPRTPVGEVSRQSEALALFAATLGAGVTREIEERFGNNNFALGAMFDSAASAAADRLSTAAERRFAETLARQGRLTAAAAVLAYSPGYCGWHISGQKKLFEFLHPERIGISLTESFLMQPLKSVSGVLIAAPKAIHNFGMSYPFCAECSTHGCRERIRALRLE